MWIGAFSDGVYSLQIEVWWYHVRWAGLEPGSSVWGIFEKS